MTAKRLPCARTDGPKEVFLAAIARGLTVTDASAEAGVHKRTTYKWRTADPAFALKWRQATEDCVSSLEKEAMRRALTGTQKPVYRGGELVGHITEYSDQMLMFLLKRHAEKGDSASLEAQVKGARDTLRSKFNQAVARAGSSDVSGEPERA